MQDLTITLIQTALAWEDPGANIENFNRLLESYNEDSDLIILPEMFNTGFTMAASSNAEVMEGRTMHWMAETARSMDVVICGSLIIEESGNYYNRLIWMRPDGSYEHYDKRHLFRMGDEHHHFRAGNRQLIAEIKGWKVMPLICYDLRFPVWSKNTYVNGEYAYDLLLYLANWPAVRLPAWTSLIKGRAIENLAFAAGVNRIGLDGRDYEYSGGTMVAAPWGSVISEAEIGTESILTVYLDRSELHNIRDRIGVGKDWDEFELK